MKITRKILAGLLVFQMLAPGLTLAAGTPDTVTPGHVFDYLEFNTSQNNPLSNQLGQMFMDAANKSATSDSELAAAQLLHAYLDKTTLSFSQTYNKTDSSRSDFFSLAIPEDVFQNFIETFGSDLDVIKLPLNQVIYGSSTDGLFLAYKNGNMLASDKQGIISDLLLQSPPNLLSDNAQFQQFKTQTSPDSFFRAFINFQNMPEGSVINWAKSEGISLRQITDGLEGKLMLFPASTLSTVDYSFNPALYQKVSANNLLLYTESNNLAAHFLDSLKLLTQSNTDVEAGFQEMANGLSNATGLDLTKDVAPLFKGRSAILLHSDFDHQYYPAFSLISEVSGQLETAQATLTKLRAALVKEFTDSDVTYTTSTVETSHGNLEQFIFQPSGDNDAAPEDSKTIFSFTLGLTNDNLLVFTTLSNPNLLFSDKGLSSDTEWQNQFSNQRISDLSFVNLINVRNYVNELAVKFEAPSDFTTGFTNIMAPLKSFYSTTTSLDQNVLANFRLRMDSSKVTAAIDYLKSLDWQNFADSMIPTVENDFGYDAGYVQKALTGSTFVDVNENDWFAPAVSRMVDYDIMKGYGLYFKPNQPITRAEFVKIVMEGSYSGFTIGEGRAQDFNDVSENDWFYPYLKTARANGIIDGFSDNTFHPNQPITRAEAVKILTNSDIGFFGLGTTVLAQEEQDSPLPFTDVQSKNWFYDYVYAAHWSNVIKGKTPTEFAPNALLTRAEAAMMIARYMGVLPE